MSSPITHTDARAESFTRAGADGLTKPELICRAASVGGTTEHVREAVWSMRVLISQTDDETIQDWRDTNRWVELARAWRKADSTRTEAQARAHYQRVTRALGLK